MDLANLRGSEGIVLAQAEVVVVRADDDSFVGELRVAPAQNADHVLRRGGYAPNLHAKSYSQPGRFIRLRLEFFIDRLLEPRERLPRSSERLVHRSGFRLNQQQPDVIRPGERAELHQQIFFTGMRDRIVHQDHRARSVVARIDGLVDDLSVRREFAALKDGVRIVFLRLVPQHDHSFAGGVEVRVVVIVVFGRGDPVAGEDHRHARLPRIGKVQGYVVLFETQLPFSNRRGAVRGDNCGAVLLAQLGADRDWELLEVRLARCGLKARLLELLGDVLRGAVELRRARGASFQRRAGQEIDVLLEPLR